MASPDIFAFSKNGSFSEESKTETSTTSSSATTPVMVASSSDGMFSGGDTFSSGNGEEIAVEPLENCSDGNQEDCKLCQKKLVQPRVLSCLHIFCEQCIDKLLMEINGDSDKVASSLECPVCKQTTKVGRNGAASLPFHFILTNILDLASLDISTLVCTSCKSKEKAISRCNDCANFLCASCDNAHRFMRCFEDHQVVMLEQSSDTVEKIHKPLYCSVHVTENLKYFCYSCEIPVCNECLIVDHKATEHRYEIISEAEKHMRSEVEKLLNDTKAKVDFCDKENTKLESSLQELQSQHDNAREAIKDTYDAFIQSIEKCKDTAMNDLKMLHTEREIKIMEQFHNVEKSVEQMEYCANFTRKLLEHGNGPEVLSLKKMISKQMTNLIRDIPKVDVNYSLEFVSNTKKIQEIAQDLFGKFRTETVSLSPKESTPPPTLPGMPPILAQKNATQNGSCNISQGTLNGSVSVTASSPISLPTSMQSSFDGDMSGLSSNFMLSNNIIPAESPSPAAIQNTQLAVPPVTSMNSPLAVSNMVEYNLHRLATMCDPTPDISENIMPPAPPTTQNPFIISDMLGGSDQQMQNNLLALAKIGLNTNGDMNNGSLLGPSSANGIDSMPMISDFSNISSANSPIMQQPPPQNANGQDMRLSAFSQFSGTGRSKATPMQIRVKFGSLGPARAQFNSPHGFCLGLDEEIIVADTNNHRIEIFEKNGNYKFHFGVPGKEEGQLWFPRKVAVMRTNSKFVVCDRGNERSRMQIFTKNGHFIKKIAIRYIDIVAGLAVTNQGHIVAVDSVSPTVFIISEDGDLVHWFDCSDHMREPSDIAISGTDFYVCDFKGHCVVVFSETGDFKCRIGSEKVTCFPNGIDISDHGDILIGDSHGNRFHVACYSRTGILQSEFECPYVKVSRCCGLKITSEGYIVTLAKNNHHVLVLNTLYIQ